MVLLDAVPTDLNGIINSLVNAAKGGHWSIFVSLVIVGLVYLATRVPFLSSKITGKYKIWTAAVCGVLMAVATTAIVSGDWVRAIADGFAAGMGATGLFELITRTVKKQPIDANKDGTLDKI